MTISVDQIDHWRSLPTETAVLEFKEAKTQYDTDKVFGYCVAISNEGGGHLVLGIRNQIPHIIIGTRAIDNPAGMAEKILNKLGFRVDVEELAHPDGRVVVFSIPSRPRGEARHLDGAYLMRCGESLQAMTPDRLKAIFAEDKPDWLEEPTATKIGAAKVTALLDTETYFRLLNLPYPKTSDGIMGQLLRDRLVIEERHGTYSIRRIAALILAKNLEEFPELQRKAPRVIVYQGTSKLATPVSDRTAAKGYAVGFQGLVRHINRFLPQNEVIQDALRNQMKLIPEVAIRELVANALIHQDLSIGGASVVIEVFTNRLEVSNPGEPIISVDRLIDGYQSRNERLAALMRKMRICEERGRGVDEIVRTAELYQLPAPDFRAVEKRTLATIFGHKGFDQMDREDRIRACYQHCALKWVMSERMTNQSLRERFHVPASKSAIVSQVISATIEAEWIKLDEDAGTSRRFACYLPFWA